MWTNNLDGTLPAELGKLTDLESLCAALRRRRAAIGGPVGAALTHCGGDAADVARTSSAARSAAGSARWRSSRSCTRPSPPPGVGAGAGAPTVLRGTPVRYGMPRAVLWGSPGDCGRHGEWSVPARVRLAYSSAFGGHKRRAVLGTIGYSRDRARVRYSVQSGQARRSGGRVALQ